LLRRDWTEPEIVEAIKLYAQTAFGKIHNRNPEIVALAQRWVVPPAPWRSRWPILRALIKHSIGGA
jgi:hypothetical protein